MKDERQDPMFEAISRMKFGITVSEAKDRSICIKCKETVAVVHEQYEIDALCNECTTKAESFF